ncbi:MAG: S8 family peptidase [Candidatus Sumerlaeia bacterium]|nr:S8 family peptidase [Candidatus Sumerlaeia bacterium]
MPDQSNFLIGYGERLASEIPPPPSGGKKTHPYSFSEARERLSPKIKSAARELAGLPIDACPGDQTVALVTLHPAYLAKSYYPADLLRAYGLDAVGSRAREVSPEKWAKKRPPTEAVTSELFVSGPRRRFGQLAAEIDRLQEKTLGALDLIKIEDFRVQPAEEKLKPFRSEEAEPLLEIVLHAEPIPENAFILEGFEAYARSLDLYLNLDKRRFFAEGLCFLPLRVPREVAPELARFSFLRLAREMPRLRQFRPVARATPGFSQFACKLPDEGAIDRDIRVAVFDGGVKSDGKLDHWVSRKKTKGIGDAVPEFQNHGTGVTSALLFGPLQDGVTPDRPYAAVDHYRVLDVDTKNDDRFELYTVLERIRDILDSRPRYDFINLSLGPDLPIEDNDVHAWTAVLDQLLSDGQTLAAVAVGNSGELDRDAGLARIQTPSDCVNALAVGSCDRTGPDWRRAPYSCVGPGRSPGIMKPDGLAFGGSHREPYWVLNAEDPGSAMPTAGTSYAAPTALRTAIGLRAHFGTLLSPLAIKALLLHGCDDEGHDKTDVGWGRIPSDLNSIVLTEENTAHIVYQGELRPASWVRMQVPIPAESLTGNVDLVATFCFASTTDPQDPLNYTRSGLEVVFRPHDGKRKNPEKLHAKPKPFFQSRDVFVDETDLRADAHKWETTLHKRLRMRGGGLRNPVFDVHYNARVGGRNAKNADKIPYALVLTVHSPKTKDLYNKIIQRYQTILEPLKPVVEIPIRT